MQKSEPVITEIGKIWGRDAIFLDSVSFENDATILLKGSITLPKNCNYSIRFNNTLWIKICDIDFDEIEYQSSFDLVTNSEILSNLKQIDSNEHVHKLNPNHNHYVFRTYDSVFNVIADDFNLSFI